MFEAQQPIDKRLMTEGVGDQNSGSWNQLTRWLRLVSALAEPSSAAAPREEPEDYQMV
jgi:hypothetical protein